MKDENVEMFNQNDLELFSNLAGKNFVNSPEKSKEYKEKIDGIINKFAFWCDSVKTNIDMEVVYDRSWQNSGTVSEYLWARILFTENRNDGLYFVIGIECKDKEESNLFIRFGCQDKSPTHEINKLTNEELNVYKKYMDIQSQKGYSDKQIKTNEILEYSWERLITETINYINDFSYIYKHLLNEFKMDLPKTISSNYILNLIEIPILTNALNVNKGLNFNLKKKDYSLQHESNQKTGKLGEEIVIEYEKDKLIKLGLSELSEKVCKVEYDYFGYDILSFDKDGNEMYIEVKTTINGNKEPFYLSANELETNKKLNNRYFLYRLCNLKNDKGNYKADCYIYNGLLEEKFNLSPSTYTVSLKS